MKKRVLSLTVLATSLSCFPNGANTRKTEELSSGKDLSSQNFVVDKNSVPTDQAYSVHDGKIPTTGQPFDCMYTKGRYSDYKLRMERRWPDGDSNVSSDILLHIADPRNPFPNGIGCNLQAGRAGLFVLPGGSDLVEYQQCLGEERPFFLVVKNVNPSSEKPAGEWGEADTFVKDGVITVYINGVHQNTGTNKVKGDHIRLQGRDKEVEFRNVTLTR